MTPPLTTTAQVYAVNDCYPTIQGEGVHTGVPVVFLRLHGCPVACVFCDTKETWHRDVRHQRTVEQDWRGATEQWVSLSADGVVAEVARHAGAGIRWVIITGGEPAIQNLPPLVDALRAAGFQVGLETSGTAVGHLRVPAVAGPTCNLDWVCVSPKINNPGGRPLIPAAIASADEIKFVIGKRADLEEAERFLDQFPRKRGAVICLQPMSASKTATALCIETVQQRGWRLSLQTHKFAGLA